MEKGKEIKVTPSRFAGKFIAVKPDYNGLKIANAAGLSIAKGEFQKHPDYEVDPEVFIVFNSVDEAKEWCNKIYPPGSDLFVKREAKPVTGSTSKPSPEEMRRNARPLGVTTSSSIPGIIAPGPEAPKNNAKNTISFEEAKSIVDQNKVTVLKRLVSFASGISEEDKAILTAAENKNPKKARKEVLDAIDALKVL